MVTSFKFNVSPVIGTLDFSFIVSPTPDITYERKQTNTVLLRLPAGTARYRELRRTGTKPLVARRRRREREAFVALRDF